MTNNACPLLRITFTLLPLALLLALLRLMPFEHVQSQGMDKIGIVTLEILEYGIRSASFQLNPRLGAIQYWPRTVEPISVHAFCRHPSARTAPTAPIQLPDYGELSVQVLVGPHGQMLDAQVHPSINPTVDHYAKRLACHLGYRPATQDSQSQTEWRAVDIRFIAEPVRSHTPGEMPTPILTPPRLARHPLHAYGHPYRVRYPSAAIRQGIQGTVGLRILVDETGQARHAEIEHSVHPLLDEAALQWAYRSTYDPATRDRIPYAEWYSETVNFELAD